MKKLFLVIALLCVLGAGASFFEGCGDQNSGENKISKTALLMDTVVTVTLWDCEDETILDDCLALCQELDEQFDSYDEDSEISMINTHPGQEVPVSASTIELLTLGKKYEALSGGKFTMEIGALTELWDFHQQSPVIPEKKELDSARKTVKPDMLTMKENAASVKEQGTRLDLGGIAKGYIADCMKEYLTGRGVSHGLIYLGGNVLAFGGKPDGSAFTIGIQEPFAAEGTARTGVRVSDGSVVTSGVYQRYFRKDGRLYHHILDPDTGYPVETDLYSATILSEHSVDGDAFSTICMLFGLERAKTLVEETEGVEAIFITEDDEMICTSGITKEMLTK